MDSGDNRIKNRSKGMTMNRFRLNQKAAVRSKGFTGSTGATILSALALVFVEFSRHGEVPPAESALLVSAMISGMIGAWGRLEARSRITKLY